jgi:membrane-bound ClpP family serine protease
MKKFLLLFIFSFFCFSLSYLHSENSQSKDLEKRLQEYIKYNEEGPNYIGHIYIGGHDASISQATWLYVKNAMDYYKKEKPIFVILELDTPGGEVFSAQKISDALKELDTQYNIPIVAYINNWAISAGAMLAYSSRFIVIVKDASMGAAEPITASAEGKYETASEKVNSAIRADFANRASFFGRNPYIAEAMVDKDLILVMRQGKIIALSNESDIHSTGSDPDIVISPKGKLLTLNAQQMIDYGVADLMLLPSKLELITEAEKEKGEWPASKTALFQEPFFKQIPNATIHAYQMDWKTRFFAFLANPMVASLLTLGLLVGFYVEISSGGFGLAGTVAVTCLFLIILSSFAIEAANWLEIILLVTGLIIIGIELLILPTFGLLGVIGVIAFLAGLVGLMLPGLGSVSFELDTQTFNAAGEFVLQRLAWMSGALILSLIIISLLARYFMPRFNLFNRFVLKGREQEASKGFIAGERLEDLPIQGAQGEVLSTLRPSGKVLINGTIYDAICMGDYIEQGTAIKVAYLDGSVIVVEEVNPEFV